MQIAHVASHVLKLSAPHSYLGDTVAGAVPEGYAVRAPWRSLYSNRYETVLVEVTAEDGTTGWGEALAPVGPEVVSAVVDTLLGPQLVGRSLRGPREAWYFLRELMRERGHLGGHQADALAAIDIALWDLHSRWLGVPAACLAGGPVRDEVPLYLSGLPRPTRAGRSELARASHAAGTRRLKLHLGHGVGADLEVVDSLLELNLDLQIAVDAHWAYTLPDAVRLAQELTARGCWFLEAPLPPEDLVGHRKLTEQSGIMIAAGEAMRHRYEAEPWLSSRAIGLFQPDVARTGLTESLAMADLAATHHIPVAPHHSVCSPVAYFAGIQLARLVPDLLALEYQPYPLDATASVIGGPVPGTMESVRVPEVPGLGFTVDVDRVRELCVSC
ncbi:MAG: mandelate racemase/muconate lactonizing enzyme family protein [Propioniciclava sp.]